MLEVMLPHGQMVVNMEVMLPHGQMVVNMEASAKSPSTPGGSEAEPNSPPWPSSTASTSGFSASSGRNCGMNLKIKNTFIEVGESDNEDDLPILTVRSAPVSWDSPKPPLEEALRQRIAIYRRTSELSCAHKEEEWGPTPQRKASANMVKSESEKAAAKYQREAPALSNPPAIIAPLEFRQPESSRGAAYHGGGQC